MPPLRAAPAPFHIFECSRILRYTWTGIACLLFRRARPTDTVHSRLEHRATLDRGTVAGLAAAAALAAAGLAALAELAASAAAGLAALAPYPLAALCSCASLRNQFHCGLRGLKIKDMCRPSPALL